MKRHNIFSTMVSERGFAILKTSIVLFAEVVVKTINMVLSHCSIAPYFSSFDESNFSFVALFLLGVCVVDEQKFPVTEM